MADEPNPKMEKLLRDYSSERRKGADVPLQPATRQMLQGEVLRAYRRDAKTSLWERFRALWPRIALGSGAAAVLFIAVLSLRTPPRSPREPSPASTEAFRVTPATGGSAPAAEADSAASKPESLDRLRDSTLAQESAISGAPEAKDKAKTSRDSLDERRSAGRQQAGPTAAAAPQLDQPASPGVKDQGEPEAISARGVARARKEEAAAPPSAVAKQAILTEERPRAEGPVALPGNALTNLGAARRLRFVESPARGQREAPAEILRSFQFEQRGDEIRFYDKDGSVYSGQLLQNVPAEGRADGAVQPSAQSGERPADAAERFFRAQGTNRTLAKEVVIEGQYFEQTNRVTPSQAAASANKRAENPRQAIVGRATVGQTNQVSINAVSVEP